jgi:hypothetical protein
VAAGGVHILGSVLVRNDDLHVERAIRNAADFCDRIYAVDHMSTDGTWDLLRELSRELAHLEVRRSRRASASHEPFEASAGTRTWVLGIDGDELFDPGGLARLRAQLLAGAHEDVFRLKGHVLNCDELDEQGMTAAGYMSPPSRPVTKLFNLAAVDSWSGCSQRLHDGIPVFRRGYAWESMRYLSETASWGDDPLRCLHVCFLRRSSLDGTIGPSRMNLNESREHDRTLVGAIKRKVREPWVPPPVKELHRAGVDWKQSWYARGPRATVDATPFGANPSHQH